MMDTTSDRNRLIKLIHVGRRELRMDEETYRAILKEKTGHASASDCSDKQLERVLVHLKTAGFKIKVNTSAGSKRKGGNRTMADDDQSRMIRGIWLELVGMGIVRDSSEAALASFVCRHTKIEALQWLSSKQASSVIEHLKHWRDRIRTERTRELWAALGLSVTPSLDELPGHAEASRQVAKAALGVEVDPVGVAQADWTKVLKMAQEVNRA
jgi:phage gp16-like protein